MRYWVTALVAVVALGVFASALPVKEKKPEENEEVDEKTEGQGEHGEDWELNLEYGRYLKEVVQALESDPAFRKKLENAEVDDIKSGKIARELHFVDHNIRTKLDELKRRELERLRHLAVKEHEKKNGVDRTLLKVPVHIDHKNPTRFEVEDLKKLIVKTTEDLEKVDKQRHDEFKTYELEKEYQRKQEIEAMDEEHKKEAETKHDEEIKKHQQHPKLHHPGSKQQLEEVWEEQDHMQQQDFDPKTFFHLHDLDGNGYWDETEVKALFKKELDKMYDPNAPEDDMNERFEEMERMREHVFKESDTDHDSLISFREFVEQTKRVEFEQDNGWQGLDEQELYSQQEYERYQQQRDDEIRQLVESGAIPPPPGYHSRVPVQAAVYQGQPHPNLATPQHHIPQVQGNALGEGAQQYHVPQGYQQVPQAHQVPQGYQQVPQGYHQVPQGYQQVPQGYQQVPQGYQQVPQGYQQVPQGYQQLNQVPQSNQQVNQVPQGYKNAQQVPQGYQNAQQVPQGHQNVGQVPQGVQQVQYRPQVQGGQGQKQEVAGQPQQGSAAQGQVPQGQVPQGQIPQGQVPQGQIPQGQVPQGQVPQGQAPQGQVQQPPQGQPQAQGQAPGQPQVQAQPPQVQSNTQGQVVGQPQGQGQVVGQHPNIQVPISGQMPQHPQPIAGDGHQ